MFKFIHTADIHLGGTLHISTASIKSNLKQIQDTVFNSFKNIIDAAIKYEIDFLLISGDLFDGKSRNIKCDKFFIEQCERIKTIPIYIICGNHDPENEKIEAFSLPENVYMFNSDKVDTYDFYKDNNLYARIFGISYKKRNEGRRLHELYNPDNSSVYNIAMLHTALEKNSINYVPCSIEELKLKPYIHYWALGHIHKPQILNKQNPFIGYPGIPQGTDLGETGMKGCFLVEVNEDFTTNVRFINTCDVIWERISINIKNIDIVNIDDLQDFILKKAEDLFNYKEESYKLENPIKGYSVQWIVEGETELHKLLSEKEEDICIMIKDNLNQKLMEYNPYIYTHSICIRTTAPIKDLNKLIENNLVFKELEKVYNLCLQDEETRKDLSKLMGQVWQLETDSETLSEDKFLLSEDKYKDLILEAKNLLLMKILEVGDKNEI